VPKINTKHLRKIFYNMIMTFCKSVQARLPIYVLLLSGNNCLLYSSIGISFKSIKKENEIRAFGRLTGIA
jgi:hypothetical protein